ncbi:DNA/RNA non-specific endonuclease [Salinithrix halophila]|uniref:DNA/RNA non-specific endonuclease n=1 Tax=Salinithrix halophila TaxID=1485204 RepID=A0ABV8JEC9_9BACL
MNWLRRMVEFLQDRKGASTIEYIITMAVGALFGTILLNIFFTYAVEKPMKYVIEMQIHCINQDPECRATDAEDGGDARGGSSSEGSASNHDKPSEDEGFWDKLMREAGEKWDGFKESTSRMASDVKKDAQEFADHPWESVKNFASDTWEGMKYAGEVTWEWTKEHKEEIAVAATIAAGVGLLFVPGGQAFGAGILIGAATSGGIAYFSGADSKTIAREMTFGGITGIIGGGVGFGLGKVAVVGASRMATSSFARRMFPRIFGVGGAGGAESIADDLLHGRRVNWKNATIATLTAIGVFGGSFIGGKMLGDPVGPMAGMRAANQADTAQKTVGKVQTVEYGQQFTRVNRKKALKPNVKYTHPKGYSYKTDGSGRINSTKGELTLETSKRKPYSQRIVGREDRASNDHGGHLIASIFGGSGDIDNLVPMNQNLNQGRWKALENKWADSLKAGKKVEVNIKPKYKGDSRRPDRFEVRYRMDGKDWIKTTLENSPEG